MLVLKTSWSGGWTGAVGGVRIWGRNLVPKLGLPRCLRDVEQLRQHDVFERYVIAARLGLMGEVSETNR